MIRPLRCSFYCSLAMIPPWSENDKGLADRSLGGCLFQEISVNSVDSFSFYGQFPSLSLACHDSSIVIKSIGKFTYLFPYRRLYFTK